VGQSPYLRVRNKGESIGLRDNKWPQYLDLCNYFSFVCPHGVIDRDEVPETCGLYYVAKTGTRLFVKKKPPHREVELPESLFRYIIMCRTTIGSENTRRAGWRKQFWIDWMKTKELDRNFGFRVGKTIQKRIEEEVDAVRIENRKLLKDIESYAKIREITERLGINMGWVNERDVVDKAEAFDKSITPQLVKKIKDLRDDLNGLADAIDQEKGNQ